MFFEVLTYMTATSWILFSLFLYGIHYLFEVVLDLPIAGESPCSAHASLKNLIQRFIHEAAELPNLRKSDENHPAIPDDTNDRNYEDLLSTAIINKVVQSYQDQAPSVSGSVSTKSYKQNNSEKEYFLGERNLDKFTDDTSSISSLDDFISTNGSTKYFDQMNLAIQPSIEEVSSSDEEPENDVDEVDSASIRDNEWQENWYLRKRNFVSGTNSPVPVPMLVPNPSQTAKVLIGDREAEDTSDLSDAMSDYEDSAEPSSLNAVLVNSKTIIGGRNPLESLVAKAESISDGSIDEIDRNVNNAQTKVQVHVEDPVLGFDKLKGSLQLNSDDNRQGDDHIITETCNNALLHDDVDDAGACADIEDHSLLSLESHTEKDLEYTEKYATLPRKIPMPAPRQSKLSEIEFTNTSYLIDDSKTDNGDSGVTSDEDDKQKSFKGSSYGEREKDKWNHAVDLPNNPYSKSNLERRLSNRSSSVSSLNSFGADYFAKAAGKPQGALKKDWNKDDNNDEESNAHPVDDPEPDDPIIPKENIFRAVPVLIQPDEELNLKDDAETSIEYATTKKPHLWELSSDSDYSIERTYNINSGKIIKKLGDEQYEHEVPTNEQNDGVAKGLKYTPKKFDENQNAISPISDTHVKRSQFLRSLTHDDDDDELSVSPVTPPAVNHFKLVNEIANETSDQYHIVPISPPAEYKSEELEEFNEKSADKIQPIEIRNDVFQQREGSIEYETNEKSYDFSIEDVYDEETSEQAQHLNHIIYEQSLPGQLFHEKKIDDKFVRQSLNEDTVDNEEVNCATQNEAPNETELETGKAVQPEVEIDMLKEKHIVRNLLGAFSKSYPNLTQSSKCDENQLLSNEDINYCSDFTENDIEIEDASIESVPSVQNLKKMFENESGIKKEVHSLTARSLPKYVRQELAAQTTVPRTMPRGNNLLSETTIEEEKNVEFPRAKNKIAYFEQMSNK